MGNCQAIDNATLLVQHPNGRVDKLYCSVTASEIMKMNPGHYVALLLTTTLCHSNSATAAATTTTTTTKTAANNNCSTTKDKNNIPVRITRIKLLRPTDTLVLGHVYRLITTQEVMKGLWAKKYAKKKQQSDSADDKQERLTAQEIADLETAIRKYQMEKNNQIVKNNQGKHERSRSKTCPQVNSAAAKSRAWQPKLQSISEAGS